MYSSYGAVTGFSVNPEIHVIYDDKTGCQKTSIQSYRVFPGGSAFNIHLAIQKTGIPARLLAALGASVENDLFRIHMDRFLDPLDTHRLLVREGGSSLGIILRPNSKKEILSWKPSIIQEKIAEARASIKEQLDRCKPRFAILTGLMPDEICLAEPLLTYQEGKIALSPHVKLIQLGGLAELLPKVQFLFLSAFECRSLFGDSVDLQKLKEFAKQHRLEFVSVTKANHGALVATPDEAFCIPPIVCQEPVVDTTGAGDAFVAGTIIAFLMEKMSVRTAAVYGACHARLACSLEGASTLPPWSAVEELVTKERERIENLSSSSPCSFTTSSTIR